MTMTAAKKQRKQEERVRALQSNRKNCTGDWMSVDTVNGNTDHPEQVELKHIQDSDVESNITQTENMGVIRSATPHIKNFTVGNIDSSLFVCCATCMRMVLIEFMNKKVPQLVPMIEEKLKAAFVFTICLDCEKSWERPFDQVLASEPGLGNTTRDPDLYLKAFMKLRLNKDMMMSTRPYLIAQSISDGYVKMLAHKNVAMYANVHKIKEAIGVRDRVMSINTDLGVGMGKDDYIFSCLHGAFI